MANYMYQYNSAPKHSGRRTLCLNYFPLHNVINMAIFTLIVFTNILHV